jgi:hypothetical protein
MSFVALINQRMFMTFAPSSVGKFDLDGGNGFSPISPYVPPAYVPYVRGMGGNFYYVEILNKTGIRQIFFLVCSPLDCGYVYVLSRVQ